MENKFVVDPDNQEMFEVFCDLHPVEAFDLNKEKFCDYARKRVNGTMSNHIIEELINEQRKENEYMDNNRR